MQIRFVISAFTSQNSEVNKRASNKMNVPKIEYLCPLKRTDKIFLTIRIEDEGQSFEI